MGANKNSDRQKCGNILINVKTIKNKNKVFTFHCAFCSTDCDQLKKFSKHLEEHLNHFENTEENVKCPILLFEPEEIKVEEPLEMEVFDDGCKKIVDTTENSDVFGDPLETRKSEKNVLKQMCTNIEEFVITDVKNEENLDDGVENSTNCIQKDEESIEEANKNINKQYPFMLKEFSSDEFSDDSNDADYVVESNFTKTVENLKKETKTKKSNNFEGKNKASEEMVDSLADKRKAKARRYREKLKSDPLKSQIARRKNKERAQKYRQKIAELVKYDKIMLKERKEKDRIRQQNYRRKKYQMKESENGVNKSSNTNKPKKRRRIIVEIILPFLIQQYKKYDSLWKVDNISFGVKNKKYEVYAKILEDLKLDQYVNISLEDINYHMNYLNELYSKDKEQELMCKMQDKVFVPEYEHYAEMSFLSDSQGPFLCTICNEILPKYDSYCQHTAQHNGTQPFKCPSCEVTFTNYHKYLIHKKRHLGIYNFHCDICGKGYLFKNDLEWHVTSHTGDKPYLCQICGTGFRARHGYDNHIRRHEERFRYECHICKRGFNQLHALNNHVKSHLNIRDIICKICGKGFVHNKYLKRHQLIHGEVKNYKCNECGKEFFQACGLRAHRKNHHS